ncbi:FecCD family ABC transporter permease [Alteromonas oceanisediminis]|uniref:FecCD family ABC transporter permease n=1 Tax=Alteromonas oceanisediminis TaxID=2836180 RepID=UPI002023A682|nr:iron ABC transporter permease [Alteromonas oceanisediminis]
MRRRSVSSPRILLLLGGAIGVTTLAIFAAVGSDIDDASLRQHVFLQLTLPLVINAMLVGFALSASAACLQVLLNNPLADPGIIGISSGASLMAALVLLTGIAGQLAYLNYVLPLACFMGALFSTLLIYRVAQRMPASPVAVILAGIAISTVCGAIIAWLYYFADAQALRNLTFWLMGSLHQADAALLVVAVPLISAALIYILSNLSHLNRLYLGTDAARAAGTNVSTLNKRLLLACAIAVGGAVSLAGSIAFVGLLVPHLLRLLLGYNNRLIVPAAGLCGSLLMLLIALASESWAVTTLPVSMLTATIGGPLFILVLMRGQFRLSA